MTNDVTTIHNPIVSPIRGDWALTGWTAPKDQELSYEDLRESLVRVLEVQGATKWWVGDILVQADRQESEVSAQLLADVEPFLRNKSQSTISSYRSTAERVLAKWRLPPDVLSWSCHRSLCTRGLYQNEEIYLSWRDKAVEEGWTAAQIKKIISSYFPDTGQLDQWNEIPVEPIQLDYVPITAVIGRENKVRMGKACEIFGMKTNEFLDDAIQRHLIFLRKRYVREEKL